MEKNSGTNTQILIVCRDGLQIRHNGRLNIRHDGMWCKAAKVKKPVSFHCARHTFCVLLLTKDVPIYTVQQLMCHSDISSTNVYADLMNKTKAKAVKKMPTLMC